MTISPSLLCSFASSTRCGISWRQGPHQVAQIFRMTGLPCPSSVLSSTRLPSSVLTLKFLARRPSSDGDNDLGAIRCGNVEAPSGNDMTNANSIVFRPAAHIIFILPSPLVNTKIVGYSFLYTSTYELGCGKKYTKQFTKQLGA